MPITEPMSHDQTHEATDSDHTHVQEETFRERDDSLLKRLGQMGMHALDGVYGRFSTVGDSPVHDPSIFEWTSLLEDN